MTENELDRLMKNHLIVRAASHARTLPVGTRIADGSGSKDLAIWLVVQTKAWLKERRAHSNPMVEKIWSFKDGASDVDMRIGIDGEYKKFKVTTEMTGPSSIRLRIQPWNRLGQPEQIWERYGIYHGNGSRSCFETLPVR